jgi:hypothetical protein
MPERVNLFAPMLFGTVFVSLATVTATLDGSARADDACLEQPPQPVAQSAHGSVPYDYAACHSCHAKPTEVLVWNVRYDRANRRKCWFLVDAYGRDVTAAHMRSGAAPAPDSTFSSKIASWFGNLHFMGTPANAGPESNGPQSTPPDPSRKHQGDSANTKKTKNTGGGRSSGEAPKQVSIRQEDLTLFQEFLQWRERERVINTLGSSPSTR